MRKTMDPVSYTHLVPDPEAFRSLKNISRPKNTTTKPKRILMVLASPVFRRNTPGMEPAITRRLRGIQIFGQMCIRDSTYPGAGTPHVGLCGTMDPVCLLYTSQKKAFSETVKKIKKNSLEIQSRKATDITQLQKIIKMQSELASLQISLD